MSFIRYGISCVVTVEHRLVWCLCCMEVDNLV